MVPNCAVRAVDALCDGAAMNEPLNLSSLREILSKFGPLEPALVSITVAPFDYETVIKPGRELTQRIYADFAAVRIEESLFLEPGIARADYSDGQNKHFRLRHQ